MAQAQSATDRTRDAPNSEKARTIAAVAREMGEAASNPDVADEVEARIGDRPDPSWVSRVRSKYDVHADPDDFDTDDAPDTRRAPPPEAPGGADAPEQILVRVDTIAGRLDRFASAVEDLEERVAAIEDAVDDADGIDRDELADRFEGVADDLRGV